MARFKYKGELPRPGVVVQYGPTVKLTVPAAGGSRVVIENPAGFPVGEVIEHDFTDSVAINFLMNDPRFEQV